MTQFDLYNKLPIQLPILDERVIIVYESGTRVAGPITYIGQTGFTIFDEYTNRDWPVSTRFDLTESAVYSRDIDELKNLYPELFI